LKTRDRPETSPPSSCAAITKLACDVTIDFAKMALRTSRTDFVLTCQVCTAVLAVVTPLLEKYKTNADCYRNSWQSA